MTHIWFQVSTSVISTISGLVSMIYWSIDTPIFNGKLLGHHKYNEECSDPVSAISDNIFLSKVVSIARTRDEWWGQSTDKGRSSGNLLKSYQVNVSKEIALHTLIVGLPLHRVFWTAAPQRKICSIPTSSCWTSMVSSCVMRKQGKSRDRQTAETDSITLTCEYWINSNELFAKSNTTY